MSALPTVSETRETRRALLASRAHEVAEKLGGGDLAEAVADAASWYWDYDGASADDFCLQSDSHVSPDKAIVFGGSNRLRWSPYFGFRAWDSTCSDRFMDRYKELGQNPGVDRR